MWQKMIEVAVRDFFDSWLRDDIKSQFYIDHKTDSLRVDLTYKEVVISRSDVPLNVLLQALMDFKAKTDKEAPTKKEFIEILYDMQMHYGPFNWESPVKGDQAVALYHKLKKVVEFTTETEAAKRLETGYYDFYVTKEEFDYFKQTF